MDVMDTWRWAKTSQMRVVESCTWMQSPRVEWLVKTVHTWESFAILEYVKVHIIHQEPEGILSC